MKKNTFFIVACFIFLFIASCKKEYSYEGGSVPLIALGSLHDSLGNCSEIKLSGDYKLGTAFTDNNFITVQVNIIGAGSYTIYTDTTNGFYFMASGFISNNGLQSIRLKAYGQPAFAVVNNFTVHFNQSSCMFIIGQDAATFNFTGNCNDAIVNGIYQIAAKLDASDSVDILVNVIKPGPFNLQSTTVNGMSFAAAGNFLNAGNYTITLKGSGTPIAVGTFTLPITSNGNTCSFEIDVNGAATSGDLFWQYTVEGNVQKGVLDSAIRSIGNNALYPANVIYELEAYGRANGSPGAPITFQIDLNRINNVLSTGSYIPAILGSRDFTGYVGHADFTGNLSASNDQPSFTIVVTSYDTTSRLVEGTFSGPVIDHLGQTHTMTDGSFRTYFKK
ncbi:MAG: hypothetical protein M3R50_02300 [Bacteroidota bacterium]|nr:hypothetical protein [Bacteroidota bacterium]